MITVVHCHYGSLFGSGFRLVIALVPFALVACRRSYRFDMVGSALLLCCSNFVFLVAFLLELLFPVFPLIDFALLATFLCLDCEDGVLLSYCCWFHVGTSVLPYTCFLYIPEDALAVSAFVFVLVNLLLAQCVC